MGESLRSSQEGRRGVEAEAAKVALRRALDGALLVEA